MIDLTQDEADTLFAMAKRRVDQATHRMPPHRGKLSVPLESMNGREAFFLDISRGGIRLERCDRIGAG